MKIELSANIKNDKGEFKIGDTIDINKNELDEYKRAGVISKIVSKDEPTLDEMKVADLKKLAEAKGIEGFDKMKRDELIVALKAVEANDGEEPKEE